MIAAVVVHPCHRLSCPGTMAGRIARIWSIEVGFFCKPDLEFVGSSTDRAALSVFLAIQVLELKNHPAIGF